MWVWPHLQYHYHMCCGHSYITIYRGGQKIKSLWTFQYIKSGFSPQKQITRRGDKNQSMVAITMMMMMMKKKTHDDNDDSMKVTRTTTRKRQNDNAL